MFVLDTDVCSYAMKRRYASLVGRIQEFAVGQLKVSAVTVYELKHGARRSGRYERLIRVIDAFLDNVEILPFGSSAARHAGDIRADLEARGTPIGAYDLLIAGHARALDATLVTGNLGELSRVDGLRVESWVSEVR